MANVTSEVRKDLEAQVVAKACADAAFRKALIASPHAAVEKELGIRLPASVHVRVVEESADNFYLVLPQVQDGAKGGELSDLELEAVAGGKTPPPAEKKAPIRRNGADQMDQIEQ